MAKTRADFVLGTAGHIDHGKSALVKALTGTDPDRLAEEKERGITIELGFARLELPDGTAMGVVDVPGHERFVRQMISGSTGIDVALLCIAADDGIMPQTREHVAVLELLAVPSCIVALTKCDRADDEWAELVAEDVRTFLAGTRYAGCPVVRTSARTGEGLDALRDQLATAASSATSTLRSASARMPVDRVFTIKGAGTVVTGTLWSGSVRAGDELEVLPSGRTARVRAVQMHDTPVDEAPAGNRVALNLAELKTSEVRPGDFLAEPITIQPTDRFDCWFTNASPFQDAKPVRSGSRVRVAHGTKEVFGRVLFVNGRQECSTRESCLAQIRLEDELPLSWQDRFVVRSYSPVRVVGGGVVIACHPRRRTNLTEGELALCEKLRDGDAEDACQMALSLQTAPVSANDLAHLIGALPAVIDPFLRQLADERKAVVLQWSNWEFFTTAPTLQKSAASLESALVKFHAEQPDAPGMAKGELLAKSGLRMDTAAFDALLEHAAQAGKLVVQDGVISHPKAGAGARQLEEQNARRLARALADAGATPPSTDQLAAQLDMGMQALARALAALEKQGKVVRLEKTLAFDAQALAGLQDAVEAHIQQHGPAAAAELKDAMGISRKFAIPVLEHFDKTGVTLREGDVRTLANRR